MNKAELSAKVAEKAKLTKKASEEILGVVLETIKEALASGDKVQLVGFGTFEVKTRAARQGINPRTKQPISIAAAKTPRFKAGKALKEAVE